MNRQSIHGQLARLALQRVGLGSTLLLAFGLVLGLLSLSGCKELELVLARRTEGASHGVAAIAPARSPVVGMQSDRKIAAPGSIGMRKLFKRGALPAGGRFEWWPPLGAANFEFAPGDEPLPGGPPFVWNDIPAGEERTVSFRYSSGGEWGAVDTFSAYDGTGRMIDRVMNVTEGLNPGARTISVPLAGQRAAGVAAGAAGLTTSADTVDVWRVLRTISPQDSAMTTERCQQLVDWVQSEEVFFALRLPISATTYVTEAHPVSIYVRDPYSHTLRLVRTVPYPSTTIVTLSLSLRDGPLNFGNQALPAAEGEEWVTLGVWDESAQCPEGLDLAAGTWAIISELVLDLSHQPDNCAGCVLPGYFCYEGQQPPLAPVVSTPAGATSYQGWGITCVGPEITDLGDTSPWVMSGASTQLVTRTEVISLPHFFYVQPALGSVPFSLSMTSTLDIGWGFYEGSASAPDLDAPISQPFSASGLAYFWLVSAAVPTTTADGPYSIVLSATAVLTPADARWASDLIWVGDWVAPPLPTTRYRTYLPIVTKSHEDR